LLTQRKLSMLLILATPVVVVQAQQVQVTVRNKDTEALIARPRYMTRAQAASFKLSWDFHHIDSDCYIHIE